MTLAEIRIQLARFEKLELKISCLDNSEISNAVKNLYNTMRKEIYKDNPSALKQLNLA